MSSLACPTILLSLALGADGDAPVARWEFGAEESTPVIVRGNIQRDQAGPRPPEFPDMAASNTAVRLDASAYLAVPDTGPDSDFDFSNGNAITIEAWLEPASIRDASPRYIIGKGRTGSPNFSRDNQNWSLRLVSQNGSVHLSFLFATRLSNDDRHWHRWTSEVGFPSLTGWHHIAVSYQFGEPESIRGWIDGVPTDGTWDLGGATTEPPVVDDDEVRIGNTYEGLLDAVAVHRAALDDEVIAARFHRVGGPRLATLQPEVMPEVPDVPDGRVVVQICEGLPTHERWLNEGEMWPLPSARWIGGSFLLPRLPLHYDDWGIRSGWSAPLLLRMAADVELPSGDHRFLIRARSLARLWVDGQLVARTPAYTQRPPDGEEPITPVAEPPLPGLRRHGYHQQEAVGVGTVTVDPALDTRRVRVVFESVVGGDGYRTETGEICVAVRTADGKTYNVLVPAGARRKLPLTDEAIEPALVQIEASLSQYDDESRRGEASSQDEFWQRRHDAAREWAQQHSAPAIPQVSSARHPVDAFVAAKIQGALAAASHEDAAQAQHFHAEVLPILREHCFRCHGDKDKGGLMLNSRQASLNGGDSEIPAVVPGDVEASELIARIRAEDEGLRMPPTDEGLTVQQISVLESWVQSGAPWPAPPLETEEVAFSPLVGDEAFLRRVYLDTVGVPPTIEEIREALTWDGQPACRNAGEASVREADPGATAGRLTLTRMELVDQLLDDDRLADHWMTFWLDLLAENPSLLNASLNSTGPFRWFLHDALRDHKSLDRMITELLLMRGSSAEGGSAGFALAGENDAPFAAKGHIVASAFLGIELQCARCHDSPYHSTTQRDLYSLAAMFDRKPVTVPVTSRVPAAFFEKQNERESLIQATLSPDESITPQWPFGDVTGVTDGPHIDQRLADPLDSRERLAALITAPENDRFPRVMVNRIWKQLIGVGLVEPVHDWEGNAASHPELLDWLAHELISHDYELRHVVRLILSSETYQREAAGRNLEASAELRFFNTPERRRLTAEQIVDSLHVATGRPIDVEELTFVHDGRRPLGSRLTLGRPTRAWMFGDLKNERDRPSLSLPRARAVVDVLEAFGWTGARQMPISGRETDPNVLQPGVLANGTLSVNLTRAAWQSDLAGLAIHAETAEAVVEALFLRTLGRRPQSDECAAFTDALANGFETRLVTLDVVAPPEVLPALPQVTWFNHGRPRANEIQLEIERRVRRGPPPDPRLRPEWREVYEDVVWSLINHREFVWMP